MGDSFAVAAGDFRHRFDLTTIVGDDARVGNHRFDVGQFDLVGNQLRAPLGAFVRLRLQPIGRDAGDDRVSQAVFGLIDFS